MKAEINALNTVIKREQNKSSIGWSEEEKMSRDSLLLSLISCKRILLEVQNYGGINSLIQKASIVSKNETLFPEY